VNEWNGVVEPQQAGVPPTQWQVQQKVHKAEQQEGNPGRYMVVYEQQKQVSGGMRVTRHGGGRQAGRR